MSVVIPALKGKIGNTDYFQAIMTADELVRSVRAAKDTDEWANMSIADRLQREPSMKRIKEQIVPYLANHADRFFGSIIVLVWKGKVEFESLSEFNAKVPKAYENQGKKMGFMTIDGGTLIALDGQHRLLALNSVCRDREIEGEFVDEVPSDQVSVIFINHEDNIKTRNIFNTVNKYAKPTSTGDNIITSETDCYAILSRWLLDKSRGGVIPEHAVNWTSNTLSDRSTKLTTIKIIYEVNKKVLIAHYDEENSGEGKKKFDPQTRPSDQELKEAFEIVNKFWKLLFANLKAYDFINKNEQEFNEKVVEARLPGSPNSLLFKPAAQEAYIMGILAAAELNEDGESIISVEEAIKKSNKINWSMESDIWQNVIIKSSGAIDGGSEGKRRASLLIAWLLIGKNMSATQKARVQEAFNDAHGKHKDLPDPIK